MVRKVFPFEKNADGCGLHPGPTRKTKGRHLAVSGEFVCETAEELIMWCLKLTSWPVCNNGETSLFCYYTHLGPDDKVKLEKWLSTNGFKRVDDKDLWSREKLSTIKLLHGKKFKMVKVGRNGFRVYAEIFRLCSVKRCRVGRKDNTLFE
jgi:hypothetical protein